MVIFVVKTTSLSVYKDTKNNRNHQIIGNKKIGKFSVFLPIICIYILQEKFCLSTAVYSWLMESSS